jgi:stage III sporulation protein AG
MNNKFDIKKYLPIIIGVVGIIIVLFAGTSGKKAETELASTDDGDLLAYTEMLESKIKRLCEACDGVSSVTVAVTLDGGFEYEYAKNTEYGKNSYGDERREEYLVIGQGSGERCVIIRRRLPEISGVGIVCRGGESDIIRERLVGLISSTLNIGSNKIYITSASQ